MQGGLGEVGKGGVLAGAGDDVEGGAALIALGDYVELRMGAVAEHPFAGRAPSSGGEGADGEAGEVGQGEDLGAVGRGRGELLHRQDADAVEAGLAGGRGGGDAEAEAQGGLAGAGGEVVDALLPGGVVAVVAGEEDLLVAALEEDVQLRGALAQLGVEAVGVAGLHREGVAEDGLAGEDLEVGLAQGGGAGDEGYGGGVAPGGGPVLGAGLEVAVGGADGYVGPDVQELGLLEQGVGLTDGGEGGAGVDLGQRQAPGGDASGDLGEVAVAEDLRQQRLRGGVGAGRALGEVGVVEVAGSPLQPGVERGGE